MPKIKISVIIANRNGAVFLTNCLKSIFREKNSLLYEVIVIDDASQDESAEIISSFAQHHNNLRPFFLKTQAGAAEARNIGITKSRGKYLFFLDNDTELKKGWLEPLENFFQNYPRAGIAQVKLLRKGTNQYDYAGDYLSRLGFLVERARYAEDKGQFDQIKPIFSGKSAGMIARRETLEKLGGFDQDYIIFLEDTDIMWRAWLAGWQVFFLPHIIVYHAYGTPQKKKICYRRNRVNFRGCQNMLATLIKNLGLKRLLYTFPLHFCIWFFLACFFALKKDWFKSKEIFKGLAAALKDLPRALKKRRRIQKTRQITDKKLFRLIGTSVKLKFYLDKAFDYLNN